MSSWEIESSCPCAFTVPCDPRCTCTHPGSSFGCRRCCAHGSYEQRAAKAKFLAAAIDSVDKLIVVTDGLGNGLYRHEVCNVGTCLRPPNHAGQHDQFDGPRSPDSVALHPIKEDK